MDGRTCHREEEMDRPDQIEPSCRPSCHCVDYIAELTSQYHPGYFGKVGMRHYHLLRNQYFRPTINIDKVSSCSFLEGCLARRSHEGEGEGEI
jgi:hypothetical protein